MSVREQTFASPYHRAVNPEAYAADPMSQHDLVVNSVQNFMHDPFEASEDLRGKQFEVLVHEDGMHVTIRETQG